MCVFVCVNVCMDMCMYMYICGCALMLTPTCSNLHVHVWCVCGVWEAGVTCTIVHVCAWYICMMYK